MTFKTNCQISKGLVDPAPLVDVVFLLLLFFVLSSPFVMQTGFGVVLPSAATPTITTFQSLVVTVKSESLIFFNNQPVTMPALEKALRDAVVKGRGKELIVKADRQVPHGTIVEIMGLGVKAGCSVINLATRIEAPGAPAKP